MGGCGWVGWIGGWVRWVLVGLVGGGVGGWVGVGWVWVDWWVGVGVVGGFDLSTSSECQHIEFVFQHCFGLEWSTQICFDQIGIQSIKKLSIIIALMG